MSTIVTRAGKGSPLSNEDADNNFINLNTDKLEAGDALGTPASVTLTNATGLPTAGLVDNAVTDPKLRDSAGLSVIGRGANSTGDPADIVAGTNKQVLRREGSDLAFGAVDLASNQAVTGTLPVNQGGTGITSFGAGVAAFLGTPSSANLAAAVTDETGTGALVFATSPTLVTPALGTPASGVATNLTGLPLTTGVTGTLPVANGGTGLTSYTANGVVFASGTGTLASGAGLTFDGTTLHTTQPTATASTTPQLIIERDNSGQFIKFIRTTGGFQNEGGLIGADSVGTYFSGGLNTNNMIYIDSVNSNIQFFTGSAERARIDSDGLKFNGDTAAANALDDYETGTWTPSFTRSDATGFTYTPGAGDAATYTKIGRQVFVKCVLDGTFSGGAGAYRILTLPITPAGGATSYFSATVADISAGSSGTGFTNASQIVFLDITPVSGNIVSVSAVYTV